MVEVSRLLQPASYVLTAVAGGMKKTPCGRVNKPWGVWRRFISIHCLTLSAGWGVSEFREHLQPHTMELWISNITIFPSCFAKAAIWEIGFCMRSLKKCGILMHFDRPKWRCQDFCRSNPPVVAAMKAKSEMGLEYSEDQLKPLVHQLPPDPPELSRWPSATVMSEGLGHIFFRFFSPWFWIDIGRYLQIGNFRGRTMVNQQIWGFSHFQTKLCNYLHVSTMLLGMAWQSQTAIATLAKPDKIKGNLVNHGFDQLFPDISSKVKLRMVYWAYPIKSMGRRGSKLFQARAARKARAERLAQEAEKARQEAGQNYLGPSGGGVWY